MLEDDNQNGGNSSGTFSSDPPPTPVRDTNDTQIKTENGTFSTK